MREAGIVMPNPAFDIHLRDLDFVKAIAQKIAEQRQAEQAAPNATPREPPPVPQAARKEPA